MQKDTEVKFNQAFLRNRYDNLTAFQQTGLDLLKEYSIILNPESVCWSRVHAHPTTRTICKMELPKSRVSLFELLHEIGHIVDANGAKGTRAEEEAHATQWAIDKMRELGYSVPRKVLDRYERYIQMTFDRGLRRGGYKKEVPDILKPYAKKSRAHRHVFEPAPSGYGRTCVICTYWKSN
jgi:hypothetical protein